MRIEQCSDVMADLAQATWDPLLGVAGRAVSEARRAQNHTLAD